MLPQPQQAFILDKDSQIANVLRGKKNSKKNAEENIKGRNPKGNEKQRGNPSASGKQFVKLILKGKEKVSLNFLCLRGHGIDSI